MTFQKKKGKALEANENNKYPKLVYTNSEAEVSEKHDRLLEHMKFVANEAITIADETSDPIVGAQMSAIGRLLRQWVADTEPKLCKRTDPSRVKCCEVVPRLTLPL